VPDLPLLSQPIIPQQKRVFQHRHKKHIENFLFTESYCPELRFRIIYSNLSDTTGTEFEGVPAIKHRTRTFATEISKAHPAVEPSWL
jgi:hypothetical protein